ncbi:hypothetical protein GQ53DRAFT_689784 [Thozetella sp. PMI_491]|nr:hypothetical protein GQ53DRAFT_689784 [Thozetella sp. PMI_491]
MIALSRPVRICSQSLTFVCRRWRSHGKEARRPASPAPPVRRVTYDNSYLRSGLAISDAPMASRLGGAASRHNYQMLESIVMRWLMELLKELGPWKPGHLEYKSYGINSQQDVEREAELFKRSVRRAFKHASDFRLVSRKDNPLFWNLRNAFVRGDSKGLKLELRYAFQSCIMRNHFPKYITEKHMEIADIRFPYEWYPATRMMQRTIHLHVGPTNSGKTYNALKALENARTGMYAGPLRLLAHEVYTRFTAKGRPCALVTGEEVRIPEGVDQFLRSCTVEMSPINERFDVAVIDEIQMLADPDRGWAWTQAFLGIQAKELHLCGEERAVDIITDICARLGEKCIVHRYQRLNPLHFMNESLKGDFENLQKGDAVVSFSRIGLHTLKTGIEESTGKRCAIVYGSLPPETRAQQAALFNDPNNEYDILVASDAIGMGLNLEIKRVVFEAASKFDGMAHRLLSVPEVKQIGGRAGRYRTANQAIQAGPETAAPASPVVDRWGTPGFITALEDEDLGLIRNAFESEADPITSVGIVPPSFIIERFASYFPPNTPFTFILSRLREMGRVSERFQVCDMSVAIKIAEVIQPYAMSIEDRCSFLTAPVAASVPDQLQVLAACAKCVSENDNGHLLDIQEIDLEVLDVNPQEANLTNVAYLHQLESLHKSITLYLWLSYRYRGVFRSQPLAFHVKELVEAKISESLDKLSYESEEYQRRRQRTRRMVELRMLKQEAAFGEPEAGPKLDGENVGVDGESDGEAPASVAPEPRSG